MGLGFSVFKYRSRMGVRSLVWTCIFDISIVELSFQSTLFLERDLFPGDDVLSYSHSMQKISKLHFPLCKTSMIPYKGGVVWSSRCWCMFFFVKRDLLSVIALTVHFEPATELIFQTSFMIFWDFELFSVAENQYQHVLVMLQRHCCFK